MIVGTLIIIKQTSIFFGFFMASINTVLLASPYVSEMGRSATMTEIFVIVIVSFVMFTGLGVYSKSLEKEPCEEPPTLSEQLLDEVKLDQIHPFLKHGKVLLKKDEEDSDMLVSIVKLDERLYPKKKKRKPWFSLLLRK